MNNTFKPLLASPAPNNINFPVLVSPKLDGIRVCIVDGKAVTRTLKNVPNRWIFEQLSNPLFDGLDGEIIVGDPTAPDVFTRTTSAVMSHAGNPDFTFRVFDVFRDPTQDFHTRHRQLFSILSGQCQYCDENGPTPEFIDKGEFFGQTKYPNIFIVLQCFVQDEFHLNAMEESCVAAGFEGVMVRKITAPYKFGRSTAKEGILLKIKRFADAEGSIIRVEERMSNQNQKTTNALGYSERSTAKAGMVPTGVLGAIIVAFGDGMELAVGTGFTDEQRRDLWFNRASLPGKMCRYKYQPSGAKDLPRFPVFSGFRNVMDIGDAA